MSQGQKPDGGVINRVQIQPPVLDNTGIHSTLLNVCFDDADKAYQTLFIWRNIFRKSKRPLTIFFALAAIFVPILIHADHNETPEMVLKKFGAS